MSSDVNSKLNDESIPLEEKLALISKLTAEITLENQKRVTEGLAPIDPADATQCDGCS